MRKGEEEGYHDETTTIGRRKLVLQQSVPNIAVKTPPKLPGQEAQRKQDVGPKKLMAVKNGMKQLRKKEFNIVEERLNTTRTQLLKYNNKLLMVDDWGVDIMTQSTIRLYHPELVKLIENNVLSEYAAIAKEAYLVLGALTRRLPNFYSHMQQMDEGTTKEAENWCWAQVGPMIDSALESIRIKEMPLLSLLEAVIPEDNAELCHGTLPWLPDFVPKIGLEILKNGPMSFDGAAGSGSFVECLCYLRKINQQETSIASSSCLQGLLRVAWCVDKLISLANNEPRNLLQYQRLTRGRKSCCWDSPLLSA
ncbi:hypothetical protein RND71_000046 [Anisodus tanguticus]|uniref:Uncharacterized protein n=1 Tax=Anisodus tanguticus TaxID=243964 RepID=A0AAE1SYD5_9SOLA|nr:hypothetical protein RND71_000046 [Anisodus tanguticus]